MIEEKEEIWIAEVVATVEMTEEVVAVKEEAAAVVEIGEVAVAREEEVADLVVVEEVVDLVVEVVVVEEQAVGAEEEDKFEIKTKIKTRN